MAYVLQKKLEFQKKQSSYDINFIYNWVPENLPYFAFFQMQIYDEHFTRSLLPKKKSVTSSVL